MKIVIDIPDTDYQVRLTKIMLACYGCEVIELPKGHGRLIDENDLWFEDIDDISCVTQRNVENVPTIIEADKK